MNISTKDELFVLFDKQTKYGGFGLDKKDIKVLRLGKKAFPDAENEFKKTQRIDKGLTLKGTVRKNRPLGQGLTYEEFHAVSKIKDKKKARLASDALILHRHAKRTRIFKRDSLIEERPRLSSRPPTLKELMERIKAISNEKNRD